MPETREPPYLEYVLAEGKAEITGEGRAERIHYKAASHSERWADPEEKVRAEFWAELIYKYDYPPERIRFEVNVPRRTPNDFADIVRGVQDRGHADGQYSVLSTCSPPVGARRINSPLTSSYLWSSSGSANRSSAVMGAC